MWWCYKTANRSLITQESGATVLHGAAALGLTLHVELLLVYGANPSAKDYSGKTPADYAW